MSMPYLSIIIPTLNSAKTLSITLESILQQSFQDFEILIIDGVSSDSTIEIAQSYHDDRIKIFSEKDKSIYDAMNKGIDLARGEWLYFLGSDDSVYDNSVFKSIFSNSENFGFDVLYGNVVSPIFEGKYDGRFDLEKLFKKNICHQAIFFRKRVFDLTGSFNSNYKIFADWDNNFKWFLNPSIKNKHIDNVVAIFAAGGSSSICNDDIYEAEKEINFLKVSKGRIGQKLKEKALKIALYKLYKRHKYKTLIKISFENFYSTINVLTKHFSGFSE